MLLVVGQHALCCWLLISDSIKTWVSVASQRPPATWSDTDILASYFVTHFTAYIAEQHSVIAFVMSDILPVSLCATVCINVCEQLMQIDRINNVYKDHSFGACGSGFGFEIKEVGDILFLPRFTFL